MPSARSFAAAVLLAAPVFAALPAFAQGEAPDPSLPPSQGSLRLVAPFNPDPRMVFLDAGGPIAAPDFGAGCSGNVSAEPTFRLDYTAASYPLVLSVVSRADTTLLVRDPAGGWTCSDDAQGSRNPYVLLGGPQSGRYLVWVGTTGLATEPATLYISGIGADPGSGGLGGGPDPNMAAGTGEARVTAGAPGALTMAVNAGGIFHAGATLAGCAGYVSARATFRLVFEAGVGPLTISANADADTTLLVRDPAGRWSCDDDSGGFLDPQLRYGTPLSGIYDIWVGTYARGYDPIARTTYPTQRATLVIDAANGGDGTSAGGPDPTLAPHFGQVAVSAGFTLGSFTVDLKAGGPVQVEGIGAECPRYLTHAPSFRIEFNAGQTPLGLSATVGNRSAPVLVHDPHGAYTCSATEVRFDRPSSGRYDIWVGSNVLEAPQPAFLTISEQP